jgi:dTDP-4-amino-4,6-dideoxygalactose transaminase
VPPAKKVPILDLKAQLATIGGELEAAVIEAVRATQYIQGPQVAKLEEQIAAYVGAKHAVGVSSGTDALLIALMALDVGHGDLVLTTTYSFFATAGVVSRVGATPVFLDIDPDSKNLDPAALAAWFDDHKADAHKVKAIIPVHLYGQCADMDPIMAIAAKHNVPVIEDGAQAIGASYPGKAGVQKAGAIGAMGCFSFFPSKNLGGIGDGGMVTTNDPALYAKLKRLRVHGAEPKYYHSIIGGNFRLDTIQAAVLLVKLPHLDKWHHARRDHASYYDEALAPLKVTTPKLAWGREHHIYNQYAIHVDGDRDQMAAHLKERGVETAIFYPVPFHLQECFKSLGYAKGALPHSEHAAAHTLALPVYPELSHEMQDQVIDAIRDVAR